MEFFLVGFLLGIAEDIIAIMLSTGAELNWRIVGIIACVALPFAAFSELIVDKKDFLDFFKSKLKNKKNKKMKPK